jgi:hypothetical protein
MIIQEDKWKILVDSNKDFYGKCVIDVAREAMKLLDDENYNDFEADDLISVADRNVDTGGGITGFQAGCVAQIIVECHSRGEEFKKSWNQHYGIKEDVKGVVNPAIFTI